MPKLHLITVASLEVRSDRRVLHDTLLDEFPGRPACSPRRLCAQAILACQPCGSDFVQIAFLWAGAN
jgi:hypothetical protein